MIGDLPFWFVTAVSVFIGLALGSFTTCVVYRIPRGLSIWRNDKNRSAYRSFCPSCQTPLEVRDLIPIFSWLCLRGRCRHCGAAIGLSYLLIEILVLILVMGIIAAYGFSWLALVLCVLIPVLAGIIAFLAPKPRL